MQTYNSLLHHEFEKLRIAKLDALRDMLEADHDAVKTAHVRGQIYALRQLPEMMQEAEKASEQGNR